MKRRVGVVIPRCLESAPFLRSTCEVYVGITQRGSANACILLKKATALLGAGQGFARFDAPLKGENVGVVHHLDAQAPAVHLRALHVTGGFVHHHVALMRQGIALDDGGVVYASAVADFVRQHAVECRDLDVGGFPSQQGTASKHRCDNVMDSVRGW